MGRFLPHIARYRQSRLMQTTYQETTSLASEANLIHLLYICGSLTARIQITLSTP